jgi:hypothetical protein
MGNVLYNKLLVAFLELSMDLHLHLRCYVLYLT